MESGGVIMANIVTYALLGVTALVVALMYIFIFIAIIAPDDEDEV